MDQVPFSDMPILGANSKGTEATSEINVNNYWTHQNKGVSLKLSVVVFEFESLWDQISALKHYV